MSARYVAARNDQTNAAIGSSSFLIRQHDDPEGAVEAFAARLLAPGDATVWKRWGMVQLDRGRYLEALRSLERCQALGDPQAARDSEVQGWVEGLRGRVQGARLAVGDSGP
jgi:hypothetical protein